MTGKKLGIVAAAAATFSILLAASAQPVVAQQPELQLRDSALPVPSTDPPPPPDLLASGSMLLVVHDNADAGTLTFCEDAPSGFLAGTQWVLKQTTHVTDHGVETFSLYWLEEGPDDGAPPNGAIAATGPEGEAAFVDEFFVRLATGSECGGSSTKWWVDDQPGVNTFVWYVGVGLFSK